MLKVIIPENKNPDTVDIDKVYETSSSIYLSQRGCNQEILIYRDGCYSWGGFYCRKIENRTLFSSIRDAVRSRIEKGKDVFILNNEKELKDCILTKDKPWGGVA